MNVYRLLRLFRGVNSPRLRMLGIWALHVMNRRYLGVFLDPVLMCNLQCRMCYFSDKERRKTLHGMFSVEELSLVAKAFFPHALKLQIGCGAEPTLSPHLPRIVKDGKAMGVPYISVTTNGQLLSEALLRDMARAGLDELTISLHGTTRDVYEYFMQGASWDKFQAMLEAIRRVRNDFPSMKLRVNYTLNGDNVDGLKLFWEVFSDIRVDVLQLRPVQEIGNTQYTDFSMVPIMEQYDDVLVPIAEACRKRGITCLIPSRENLMALEQGRVYSDKSERERIVEDVVYCNITPGHVWRSDFDLKRDTFRSYIKRSRLASRLLRLALTPGTLRPTDRNERTERLNYEVR